MEDEFNFVVEKEGTRGYFNPEIDLVASTVSGIREVVKNMINSGVRILEFDMKQVEVVDSSGIGLLVAIYNSLTRLNGKLIIRNISQNNLELFKALRLDKYFTIESA